MAWTSWFVGCKKKRRGAAASEDADPDRERDPPPPPTPVTFPHPWPANLTQWTPDLPPPDLRYLFSRIARPVDIGQHHLDALNVQLQPDCSVDDLLPLVQDGSFYLPPLAENGRAPGSYADAAKRDPQSSAKRKAFDERLAELMVDNADAFRTLSRAPNTGAKPLPRLAHMRKFWEGMACMSLYWDCSLDDYFESTAPISDDASGQESPRRAKLDMLSSIIDSMGPATVATRSLWTQEHDSRGPVVEKQASPPETSEAKAPSVPPEPRRRYKGRRTSTGREMPDLFRTSTLRAFIEGTIWPFQASVAPPRRMPLVQIRNMNLPVRQSAVITRNPTDRHKARQGWASGPIMGLQVRAETEFFDPDGKPFPTMARLDLMREIGGLLLLAQERRREGKTEVKPGEGQWWTEKPRWGGGPGDEVGEVGGNRNMVAAISELADSTKDARQSDGGRVRRRKPAALLWKELKVGSGVWDPKMDYAAIGKDPRSECDEVFMVSSLNHHLCFLKLSVHGAYMDYLESALLPNPLPSDPDWCKPKLQRSHWYDLFDRDQRVTAFKSLWAIMTYLTRDTSAAGQEDEQMTGC